MNNTDMRLSIVIPVYNAAAYLRKCLDCIITNNPLSKSEYEVILVDDGSTDDSCRIVDEYTAIHPEFRALSQTNAGQGAARNRALEICCGDYIYFLDSDDYIDIRALADVLGESIEEKANLAIVDHIKIDEDGRTLSRQDRNGYADLPGVVDGGELLFSYSVSGAIWFYLYRRQLLKEHGICFAERIFHEDEEFVMKVVCVSKRILYTHHIVYYYTQRCGLPSILLHSSHLKTIHKLFAIFAKSFISLVA